MNEWVKGAWKNKSEEWRTERSRTLQDMADQSSKRASECVCVCKWIPRFSPIFPVLMHHVPYLMENKTNTADWLDRCLAGWLPACNQHQMGVCTESLGEWTKTTTTTPTIKTLRTGQVLTGKWLTLLTSLWLTFFVTLMPTCLLT